ncbi:hypothetical protein ABEB36_007106 [Hypothenemus hampei]|uniref:Glucose-methanol-choline oxidoreductase N-terminal domain-containing protein n=1 Tax=Hypothenemus hampei TaxID=57062 RepID=A0ABD1ETC5_HYPHA
MKMLSYLLVAIPLFMVQKGFGLGENGNIEELSAMVESHIVAAENYVLPKDNAKLIKVDPYKIVGYYGTFDFIIIGAGTSGSVIANRLSEIGNWTVLLLEAGGHADDFSKILGLSSYLSYSDFNWGYNSTEQQNACLGRINQQCFLTQGRGLGGSTILNGAFYARGHPEDYNRWESVYGNPGWSYDKLLPYFKKSEHAVFYPRDKKFHGVYGPFTISQVNSTPGLVRIKINEMKVV